MAKIGIGDEINTIFVNFWDLFSSRTMVMVILF